MYCKKCGKLLTEGEMFCEACGEPVSGSAEKMAWNLESFPEEKTTLKSDSSTDFDWGTSSEFPDIFESEGRGYEGKVKSGTSSSTAIDWDFEEEMRKLNEKLGLERQMMEQATDAATDPESGIAPEPVDPKLMEAAEREAKERLDVSFETPIFESITLADKDVSEETKEEIIDRFYTFNKKNEEFQKLLDREYEKIKSGNALAREQEEAEKQVREKYVPTKYVDDDDLEQLFAAQGLSTNVPDYSSDPILPPDPKFEERLRQMKEDEEAEAVMAAELEKEKEEQAKRDAERAEREAKEIEQRKADEMAAAREEARARARRDAELAAVNAMRREAAAEQAAAAEKTAAEEQAKRDAEENAAEEKTTAEAAEQAAEEQAAEEKTTAEEAEQAAEEQATEEKTAAEAAEQAAAEKAAAEEQAKRDAEEMAAAAAAEKAAAEAAEAAAAGDHLTEMHKARDTFMDQLFVDGDAEDTKATKAINKSELKEVVNAAKETYGQTEETGGNENAENEGSRTSEEDRRAAGMAAAASAADSEAGKEGKAKPEAPGKDQAVSGYGEEKLKENSESGENITESGNGEDQGLRRGRKDEDQRLRRGREDEDSEDGQGYSEEEYEEGDSGYYDDSYDDGYDDSPRKGKGGKALKIIIIILAVLLAVEIAFICIKVFASGSGVAAWVEDVTNTAVNFCKNLFH